MTLKILVVGLRPADSGKTTLAFSLARALRREGYSVVALKPVGSTEAWTHPEALRWTRERGFVVTPDAIKLSAAAGEPEPLEAVEPVAAIHAPPDPSRWEWNPSPYQAYLADPNRTAVLLRITACRPGGGSTLHMVNVEALEKAPRVLASRLAEASASLQPPPLRADSKSLEEVLGLNALAAADSCLALAASRHEVAVIESYSDVAAPTSWSLDSHILIAVAPGVAAVADGARYAQAVRLRGGTSNPSLVSAGEALHLAGASTRIDLPLLEDPETGYEAGDLTAIIEIVKGFAV